MTKRYYLSNTNNVWTLMLDILLLDGTIDQTIPIAEGVVGLAAAPGAGSQSLNLAIVARSASYHKPKNGVCTQTTNNPFTGLPGIDPGAIPTPPSDGSGNTDDWKCYRYRVYQTSIPLRNQIWG